MSLTDFLVVRIKPGEVPPIQKESWWVFAPASAFGGFDT